MSSNRELFQQYDAWKRWTEKEGIALQAGDWRAVAECQEQKAVLQHSIERATELAKSQWSVTEEAAARSEIQRCLQQLIALEQDNQSFLAGQREQHLRKQAELSSTRRNLGRVQRSYVTRFLPTWQSYS
ncbi:MAG: hypothetical protein U1G07_01390 [Verrucomicrobiota bacterium]